MRWMSLVNVERKSGWQVNFDDGKMFVWMETMCYWWTMMICEAVLEGGVGEQVRPQPRNTTRRRLLRGLGRQPGRSTREGLFSFDSSAPPLHALIPFDLSQPKIQTKWMFKSINVNNSMRIGPAGGRDRPGRFALWAVSVGGKKLDDFGESIVSLSPHPF